MTHGDREPEVQLRDGSRVLLALFEWVRDLLEQGHSIEVSAEGDVWVSPPCHPDTWHHLDASWRDTAAIVTELSEPPTVH